MDALYATFLHFGQPLVYKSMTTKNSLRNEGVTNRYLPCFSVRYQAQHAEAVNSDDDDSNDDDDCLGSVPEVRPRWPHLAPRTRQQCMLTFLAPPQSPLPSPFLLWWCRFSLQWPSVRSTRLQSCPRAWRARMSRGTARCTPQPINQRSKTRRARR